MSATVLLYTKYGFVVGSDGRSTLRSDSGNACRETDTALKVFNADFRGGTVAYVVTGHVGDDGPYDLIAEARRRANGLSTRSFDCGQQYVEAFARSLRRYMGESKRDGLIDRFPEGPHLGPDRKGFIVSLFVVGYFQGHPFWVNTDFHHRNQGSIFIRTETPPLVAGQLRSYGSGVVPALIEKNDPRFSQYRESVLIDLRAATLATGAEFANALIAAQSGDAAAAIDPFCKKIGGHIHIAAVTPDGFGWMVPPGADDRDTAVGTVT